MRQLDVLVLSGLLSLVFLLPACGSDPDNSFKPPPDPSVAGTFLNILPPGANGNSAGGLRGANPQTTQYPSHFIDQLAMYGDLAYSDEYPTPGVLANDDLVRYYKKAELSPSQVESSKTVADGTHSVTIARDNFGVPHIFGKTRDDVFFGAGYATGADRLWFADVFRHVGDGKLSEFIGPSESNFAFDKAMGLFAGYSDAEWQANTENRGPAGDVEWEPGVTIAGRARADGEAFLAGLNLFVDEARSNPSVLPQEYPLVVNALPEPWTLNDLVKVAAIVQAIFAVAGGEEMDNVRLLNLVGGPGNKAGCELWRDIRVANDEERFNTTALAFPTQVPATVSENCPQTLPPGAVLTDSDSFIPRTVIETSMVPPIPPPLPSLPLVFPLLSSLTAQTALPFQGMAAPRASAFKAAANPVADLRTALADIGLALPTNMSNAAVLSSSMTKSGHPLAVFGPQVAYFVPQVLIEMNMQGGDVSARGVTFAGLPYITIGRGKDFAWSPTTGHTDLIDTRVARFCAPKPVTANPDLISWDTATYEFTENGVTECRPFTTRTDQWLARPTAGGQSLPTFVTRHIVRTLHGPVFGAATVDGEPVALSIQRSTFFQEANAAPAFMRVTGGRVHDTQSFFDAFDLMTGTFNWFYIDNKNIAYYHSGQYPRRHPDVHPELPAWGDGRFEWQGFLTRDERPHEINPARGYFVNWNNAHAPGWWPADGDVTLGPVHRVDLLNKRFKAVRDSGKRISRAEAVQLVEDAAHADLRGQEVWPSALDVLESPTAPATLSAAQQTAIALLRGWIANGAQRRDRNHDGEYDEEAAVALTDAWYHPMIEKVLPQIVNLEPPPVSGEIPPGTDTTMFNRIDKPGAIGSAWLFGYHGYLRRVFDMALNRSANRYRQLKCAGTGSFNDCWTALRDSLQQTLDSLGPDMNQWEVDEAGERVVHQATGVLEVEPIHWTNRPTFQQVVEITGSQ